MNMIHSISKYPFYSLGENLLPNLTSQPAKIQKIVFLIFISLATCFGMIYYYFKAKNSNKEK